MEKVRSVTRRRPAKEVLISMDLRRRIIEGDFKPGSQLPKRVDLEERFDVSPLTIQRAVDRLIDEGFVYAKTGQGTFVADNPPHLSRYGIVFNSHPSDRGGWSTFYNALLTEIRLVQRDTPRKLVVYQGLELAERHEERERLIEEVRTHQLAGLIFVFAPHSFIDTPILTEPRMARVAIMAESKYGIPAMAFDGQWAKVIRHFKERGKKRLAMLTSTTIPMSRREAFMADVRAAGMETRPYWHHGVHPTAPEAAQNIVHLMCIAPPEERPDALYISDDNLVPHATAGLLAGGMSVPQEIEVVAHANFPYPTTSLVPAKRMGFDVRKVLQQCLDSIDNQRQGGEVEMVTHVGAKFEE